ncbi:hypothetical protein BJX63DRAFT_375759 [Aspergillus granulosus]|uniref:Uncharacterized protein n=1 Tax=Aspergillus granulosus TaxID=176169 RepID=A0ABR4I7N0_9EURO
MSLPEYNDIPKWGQLPAEQYLIRHWNPASHESANQQRARLIQEFLNLDLIPEELDPTSFGVHPDNRWSRVPTAEEIATILQPWRSEQIRWRAWKLWQEIRHPEPPLLRIYYNPKDDERVKSWADMSENYRDVSYWAILDDPDLFDYEGSNSSWLQVFNILPELSRTVRGYSRINIDESVRGEFFHRGRADVKEALDYVKRDHPDWRNDPSILITDNYPATSLLHSISSTRILIADKETFETGQLLYVHLDAKQNITMQGRIDLTLERLDQIAGDEIQAEMPEDVWEEGSVGEGYKMGGKPGQELFQWTKQDLEDDPAPEVSAVEDGVSRLDV